MGWALQAALRGTGGGGVSIGWKHQRWRRVARVSAQLGAALEGFASGVSRESGAPFLTHAMKFAITASSSFGALLGIFRSGSAWVML